MPGWDNDYFMAEKKNSPVSWILTLAIAGAALYFSLRGVEWSEIGKIIAHADAAYLGIAFVMASFSVFVRSVRWGVLLSAEDKIPMSTVYWAMTVGYLGNSVLPARAGELLRTTMISARSRLSWTYVFATALTGMVMDMIVLVVLSAAVIVTLPGTPEWLKKGSGTMAAFGLAGMAVLVILPHCEPLVNRLLSKIPGPEKLRAKLTGIGAQFLLGLRAFHHVSRFAAFAGISFSVWFVDAFGAVIIAKSLHLQLSIGVGILLLAGLAMASAAPSTPGYVGVYQIVAVEILPAFGFSKSDAIAYILVFQAMSYAVFVSWGLIGLWQLKRIPARLPDLPQTIPGTADEGSTLASGAPKVR
jgi:uncharacterized protein (TIRG00374 family)